MIRPTMILHAPSQSFNNVVLLLILAAFGTCSWGLFNFTGMPFSFIQKSSSCLRKSSYIHIWSDRLRNYLSWYPEEQWNIWGLMLCDAFNSAYSETAMIPGLRYIFVEDKPSQKFGCVSPACTVPVRANDPVWERCDRGPCYHLCRKGMAWK